MNPSKIKLIKSQIIRHFYKLQLIRISGEARRCNDLNQFSFVIALLLFHNADTYQIKVKEKWFSKLQKLICCFRSK